MSDVAMHWARITNWLRANAPVTYGHLNAGASEEVIRQLESVVGTLPDQLQEWLRLNDGSHWQSSGFMPELYYPLPCDQIVEHWAMFRDIYFAAEPDPEIGDMAEEIAEARAAVAGQAAEVWLPEFLPIMRDNSTGNITVDRRRGDLKDCVSFLETWSESTMSAARWRSIDEMLRHVADSMERGRTGGENSWVMLVKDGELSWDPEH